MQIPERKKNTWPKKRIKRKQTENIGDTRVAPTQIHRFSTRNKRKKKQEKITNIHCGSKRKEFKATTNDRENQKQNSEHHSDGRKINQGSIAEELFRQFLMSTIDSRFKDTKIEGFTRAEGAQLRDMILLIFNTRN